MEILYSASEDGPVEYNVSTLNAYANPRQLLSGRENYQDAELNRIV